QWTRSAEAGELDLAAFAAECGLSTAKDGQTRGDNLSVVGFDSTGVVFYRMDVPAVKHDELAAMVNLQTEALLPLPADQMESAWRQSPARNGQLSVTLAAARKEQLLDFVEQVRRFGPSGILLDCEGVVKSWREFFCGTDERAVIVSCGQRQSHLCLAEAGTLINAVNLDIGLLDFTDAEGLNEQTQVAERFIQDIRSVLDLFASDGPNAASLYVLSDGDSMVTRIVEYLNGANIKAVEAQADVERIKSSMQVSTKDIMEYSVPIGLASLALEGRDRYLDVFEHLYVSTAEQVRRRWYHSLKLTASLAAVLLVLLAVVFYAADVMSLKKLTELQSGADFKQLVQRQDLIKEIARQRPDLLNVLNEIGSGERGRIMLDSFHYTKGQPIRITGQAEKQEELFKFQKSLQEKKGFGEVVIAMSPDEKGKKTNFTITFHYRNFTAKKGGAKL
ncbi:MAG: hypothetical protein ACYTE8_11825, partial [Planctomycetota bacterium]